MSLTHHYDVNITKIPLLRNVRKSWLPRYKIRRSTTDVGSTALHVSHGWQYFDFVIVFDVAHYVNIIPCPNALFGSTNK